MRFRKHSSGSRSGSFSHDFSCRPCRSCAGHGIPARSFRLPSFENYSRRAAPKAGTMSPWTATHRRLYIGRDDHIDVVDVDAGAVVGKITGLSHTHGMVLAPDFGRGLYIRR